MTREELSDLIAEIRAGRSEDDAIDWKRAFWDLKNDASRREFIKDVSAMANSMSPETVRRIVVGVSSNGTIQGAVLPSDEANLQQTLAAITPVPNVRFELHDIEGKSVVVVEIGPPFDRPYVGKISSEHFVWMRQGSRTVTANRYQLDRLYKDVSPRPNISVSWRGLDEATDILEVPAFPTIDISAELKRLSAMRPSHEDLALLEGRSSFVQKIIEREGLESLGLGRGQIEPAEVVKWPHRLAEDIDKLLLLAQDSPEEFLWATSLREIAVNAPVVEVFNGGAKPATNIVVYLKPSRDVFFLNWVELHERYVYVGDARRGRAQKIIDLAKRSSAAIYAGPSRGLYGYLRDSQSLSHIPPAPLALPYIKRVVEVSLERGKVRIDINTQLKHNFHQVVKLEDVFLCSGLPLDAESTVTFECHADEQPDPSKGTLRIRAIEKI